LTRFRKQNLDKHNKVSLAKTSYNRFLEFYF